MALRRKYVLLAVVVLLEAMGRAEQETSCHVTAIDGLVASVDCGVMRCGANLEQHPENKTSSEQRQTKGSINSALIDDPPKNGDDEGDVRINLPKVSLTELTINVSLLERLNTSETLGDHNFESNNSETRRLADIKANTIKAVNRNQKQSSMIRRNTTSNISYNNLPLNTKYSQNTCLTEEPKHSWTNITTLNVHLKNISSIDFSSFPNITTVTVYGDNITITKVCGVASVSYLKVVSPTSTNLSFIRYFNNLTRLNLTKNSLQSLNFSNLPISVTFLDLSQNNITLNKVVIFPKTLRVLNVSSNHMNLANDTHLDGRLIILDISKNKLNAIPNLIMKTLEELNLSQNKISYVNEENLKGLTNLTVLDLRLNYITQLNETVFEGLHRLQQLDLSQNLIKVLSPSTFQYLNNLVVLSISGNTGLGNFQDFKDASVLFGTGQRLQTIEASKTNLTRIPPTLTRTVRKLLLKHNTIRSIQCGDLDSFPLLQIMDLSDNLISEIEEDAFGRLDFLSHLVLYYNKLTSIPKSLPAQLQVLDLRQNLIDKLHNADLLGLQKLKVLLLSKNKITSIEDDSLGQLVSLEVLDLSHNPIKALSRTSFLGPRRLKEIYLVSLTDLIPFEEPLSFPAPESGHLEVLNINSSPVLATQLMDDVAALTMFHELFELNINHCRLSTLRSDLPKYLPRLHRLELTGNKLNCSNIIWLVRWLQTLNISMQESGKSRRQTYNFKNICCEDVNARERQEQTSLVCSSPEYLAGRQIISLKEEDFPDLKLTSSTHPSSRELLISEPYRSQTSSQTTDLIDSFPTTSVIYNAPDTTSSLLSTTTVAYGAEVQLQSSASTTDKSQIYQRSSLSSLTNAITITPSRSAKHFKHHKVKLKNKNTYTNTISQTLYADPIIALLNETKNMIRDFDNHLNDTISSGVFLAQEAPRGSHPGMLLFLLLVGVVLGAASVMVYSQCSQNRRTPHQQDIEVSSLGGHELW